MSDNESGLADVYTHFAFTIRIVRIIENVLIPSTIHFRMEFIPLETADDSELNHVFSKMRYWLDNIVCKSVVFSHDNENAIVMFIDEEAGGVPRIGNVIVLTPEEPEDQHLAAIFQAKLQALAGDTMAFGPVEVRSDNQLGLQFTFDGVSSAVLPSNEEWVGVRSFFDEPWWNRDDASTLDVLPPEGADLSIKPSWAFNFDFLRRPRHVSSTDGTIIRPEFRPTVIDGGKDKK